MATVVASSSVNIPLANVKQNCGELAELLARGTTFGLQMDPGMIDVLKAIAGSADSTDLRTT